MANNIDYDNIKMADITSAAIEDTLPSYANGLNPNTPINSSPISFQDRFKLSIGNDEAAKIKFLQENYGEVTKLPKSGDFVVKDKTDGLWKRVDKKGFGSGDGWDIAKDLEEVIGDIADIGAPLASIATQIGIGVATGGASIPMQIAAAGLAGVGTKTAETILGKYAGTYDQEAGEQLKEIALEGLLNMGGTFIAPKMKPGIDFLSKKITESGTVLSKLPEATKNMFADFYGLNVPGGSRSVHTYMELPVETGSAVGTLLKSAAPVDAAKNIMTTKADDLVRAIKPSLSNFFGEALEKDVIDNLPNSFKSNHPNVIKEIKDVFFGKNGYLDEAGNLLSKKAIQDNPMLGDVVKQGIDDEAYATLKELFKLLSARSNIPSTNGKEGARVLLQTRRALTGRAYDIAEQIRVKSGTNKMAAEIASQFAAATKEVTGKSFILDKDVPFNYMYKIIGKGGEALGKDADDAILKSGKLVSQPTFMTRAPLEALEETYSNLKTAVQPVAKYLVDNKVTSNEALVNAITSGMGKRSSEKLAIENVIDVLGKYGGKSGELAKNSLKEIQVYNAAKDFTPLLKPGMLATVGSAGVIGSMASGNEGLATGMGVTALVTSPRLTGKQIQALMAGSRFVKSLTPAMRTAWLKNPELVGKVLGTAANSEVLRNQISSQLIQGGVNKVLGR